MGSLASLRNRDLDTRSRSALASVFATEPISDLQSTILKQIGLNYKKMDFVLNGRPFHLVEEGLGPIDAILA